MCTDKNNDKNKTNLPPPPSTPVTAKSMTSKFSDFQFVLIKGDLRPKTNLCFYDIN